MSAQIIKFSDYRKRQPLLVTSVARMSLVMFAAYVLFGVVIYSALIGFTRSDHRD